MTTASSKNKSTATNGENRSIADTTTGAGRMEADTSHFHRVLNLPNQYFLKISAKESPNYSRTGIF